MRLLSLALALPLFGADPLFESRFVFPPQALHVHSSSIVELPNGDIFNVWYYGSGERTADDVLLQAARLPKGATAWTAPYVVADTPGFPDCNPIAFVDAQNRLSIIWPVIIDNHWESALLRYKTVAPSGWTADPPEWTDSGNILLRPGNLEEKLKPFALALLAQLPPGKDHDELQLLIDRLSDKLYNRLGWMPRTHVLPLPSGRILLPLYSDTYNIGIIAISDDNGATWSASDPIVSLGGVQPSLVRRKDGSIVAYMRDNGPPPQRVIVAESRDEGASWTEGADSDIPNPGASVEVIALNDGSWLMVNNDTEQGRARLSVWISEDEGQSWPHRRSLEDAKAGSYSYPSVLQTSDGMIHVTYSHSAVPAGAKKELQAIKHATFNPEWVKAPR